MRTCDNCGRPACEPDEILCPACKKRERERAAQYARVVSGTGATVRERKMTAALARGLKQ